MSQIVANELGPALRVLREGAERFSSRHGCPPDPTLQRYVVGSLDYAETFLAEFAALPGHPPGARELLLEHYLEPGYPCLFIAEVEPCVFGWRVSLDPQSPEIAPALRLEADRRREAALEREYVAARERGRRILADATLAAQE